MRIAVFSSKRYVQDFFDHANQQFAHRLAYLEPRLTSETAPLARGFAGVCVFVNDRVDAEVARILHAGGTGLVALRCAGFNNVDLEACHELGLKVAHVPAYSPHSVAEHTVGMMLALNRQIHRAYARVREGNFELEGLMGFDMHGRTVGVVGTGRIGSLVARIMHGFGCEVLANDVKPSDEVADFARYVPMAQLLRRSDIVTLHCPLTPQTHHLIDADAVGQMKDGVMLINTSRGGLVDTQAVVDSLKSGKVGYLGLDVYEEEADLFYKDLSSTVIQDDTFARLLTFPNVIITGHQAFFTREALGTIARTTLASAADFKAGRPLEHEVTLAKVHR